METIKKYVESHKDRFLDELFELIGFLRSVRKKKPKRI
jgi:hypothetical protein